MIAAPAGGLDAANKLVAGIEAGMLGMRGTVEAARSYGNVAAFAKGFAGVDPRGRWTPEWGASAGLRVTW